MEEDQRGVDVSEAFREQGLMGWPTRVCVFDRGFVGSTGRVCGMSEPIVQESMAAGVWHHIVCGCNRQSTAIFVTEYIRDRFAKPVSDFERELFGWRQNRRLNGEVSGYDIMLKTKEINLPRELEIKLLEATRAFVAARGDYDIWA